jgi:oligosaccharide translocation protein RFT1
LGQASVDLELGLSFVLFFSREGFRLVLVKQFNDRLARQCRWVHVFVTMSALGLWWLSTTRTTTITTAVGMHQAALWYSLAALLEGWAEPRVLWALSNLQVQHKVAAESMATLFKTWVLAVLITTTAKPSVTVFGVAQAVYGIVYLVIIYQRVPLPPQHTSQQQDYITLRHEVILFTLQGMFKHALTEADRLLLFVLAESYDDKGLYAIASALGGMAARLVFAPLEEMARLLWSRWIRQHPPKTSLLYTSYTSLVRLVLYLGLVLACIGPHYTDILLQLLHKRAAAPVLSAYCYYCFGLALNGMTEAFWYAKASTRSEVSRLGMVHLGVGLVQAGLALLWTQHYGTVGLVYANLVSMLLRSAYALQQAATYFHVSLFDLLQDLVPPPMVLVAFLLALITTQWSHLYFLKHEIDNGWWSLAIQHVSVGIASLVGVATAVLVLERPYLKTLRDLFGQRQPTEKQD